MKYFISLPSTTLSAPDVMLLERPEVYGVILYGKNIRSFQTTRNLIREIKRVKRGLKIAVDEEGGLVSRVTHLISNYSQPFIATLGEDQVRKYYSKRSRFLAKLGIDINLAPVVDVAQSEESLRYKRSYGQDISLVFRLEGIVVV